MKAPTIPFDIREIQAAAAAYISSADFAADAPPAEKNRLAAAFAAGFIAGRVNAITRKA